MLKMVKFMYVTMIFNAMWHHIWLQSLHKPGLFNVKSTK